MRQQVFGTHKRTERKRIPIEREKEMGIGTVSHLLDKVCVCYFGLCMYVCAWERDGRIERERERERELVLLTQEIHSMIALVNLFLRFFGNVIFIFREKREAKKVFKYFHELVLSKCPLSLIPILGSCWKFEKNHFSIFVCTIFQKERTTLLRLRRRWWCEEVLVAGMESVSTQRKSNAEFLLWDSSWAELTYPREL